MVQHAVLFFLVSKRILSYSRRLRAAVRLQRWYHHHWLMRRAVLRVTVVKLWDHVKLFGITRAVKQLVPLERYRYLLNRFLRSFLWKSRLRRLLHPPTARLIFFSLFHSDVFSENQRAQRFHLRSTPVSTVLSPEPLPRPYADHGTLFWRLKKDNLRKSTLETLRYVLRAQHFKFLSDPSLKVSEAVPSLLSEAELLGNTNGPRYIQRLTLRDAEDFPPPTSPESLRTFQRFHRRSLHIASASQLESEALFFLSLRCFPPPPSLLTPRSTSTGRTPGSTLLSSSETSSGFVPWKTL